MNIIVQIVRGWLYRIAYITGGNFVRAARIKRRGERVKIAPTAFFKNPEKIEIGDDSFINHNCMVWASPDGPITIGKDVLLGPGVLLVASNHGIGAHELIRKQPGEDAPIVIGDDVWIGAYAVVGPGVTIGNGTVIGAGAVVVRDMPAMSVCVGVPAKRIGPRPGSTTTE